jgi:ABC-type nickel/cobalt efflux system permease component RcnA
VRFGPELLLVGAVIAVGVLHTLVPDHWAPIAMLARGAHWTPLKTARAASIAGFGHTLSTLAIALLVWFAGVALAVRFGHLVSILSSAALIGFGLWIAVASLREVRAGRRSEDAAAPRDRPSRRVALLLILGSSPMLEGIPAFFAAARFGVGLLAIMAFCFGLSTIATYVALCVVSSAALQNLSFGPVERYGEVLSGAVITVVGVVFLIWPFG